LNPLELHGTFAPDKLREAIHLRARAGMAEIMELLS